MPAALDITTHHDRGRAILTLTGDTTPEDTLMLREALEHLGTRPPARIAVDVSGLRFLDGACIGVLIGAAKRARNGGGALAIAGASGHVREKLTSMGLAGALGMHPSLDAAFAWLDRCTSERSATQHTVAR